MMTTSSNSSHKRFLIENKPDMGRPFAEKIIQSDYNGWIGLGGKNRRPIQSTGTRAVFAETVATRNAAKSEFPGITASGYDEPSKSGYNSKNVKISCAYGSPGLSIGGAWLLSR
jgi:hypothetical protein